MNQTRDGTRDLNPEDVPYESEMKQWVCVTSFLKDRVSRRELLKAGGLTGLSLSALWALACQPAAPVPTPTKAPVAVAPTPTTPAAPTPTKAPAATPTPEAKIGKHLIGKLEGPEIITDAAKFPKTFQEAPALAELVKAGKLPPVKERVGQDPLVIKPLREIGKYGGTWRRGFTGPADKWNGYRGAGRDNLLFWDYTGNKLAPNVAKGWEITDGGKTITMFLRKGVKWSDGQPLTADDVIFWHQDIQGNKDVVPKPTPLLSIEGKPGTVEKVDSYTVRWKFPAPYAQFVELFAGPTAFGGHSYNPDRGQGAYAPAHYLKQFHAKYTTKEELDKKVKEAKFDSWVKLFMFKNDWALNPEVPTVVPWKTVTPINTPVWSLERNPYSFWVDTEGNQLPYIDKLVMTLGENLEIINLRAIAGEYDMQARHLDIAKLPVFLVNQEKGGYKLYLDPAEHGADAILWINLTFDQDPEIAKWLNNVDFRRALALGIERDQLNETFWLGIGTPGSPAPVETNLYSPGPEYRTLWHTYDPKKANEMLDKIGLDKKDSDGYRLRTDGKGRLRIELMCQSGQFMPYAQILEMIREHWKKIGIDAHVAELERSLYYRRAELNEHQIAARVNDGTLKLWIRAGQMMPLEPTGELAPLYGLWYATFGGKGKEPPARIKQAMEMYRKGFGVSDEERGKIGKEIWKIGLEDVWTIGTVGLSPAVQGVRVAKVAMGNVPSRIANNADIFTPATALPPTFFWKK